MKTFRSTAPLVVLLALLTPSPAPAFTITPGRAAAGLIAAAVTGYLIAALQGNSAKDLKHFTEEIIKDPKNMGAAAPCSKYLAKDAIAELPPRKDGKPRRFLEVGAGTGVVTKQFVKKLEEGDTLDIVELQRPLCKILDKKFGSIPGVTVHCTGIENFNPGTKYDAIVMTVPFNSLPFELVEKIWSHVITNLLETDGVLSYIYYPGLPVIKKLMLAPEKRADFQNIQDHLDALYKEHGIKQSFELRNFPPVCTRYLKPTTPTEETTHIPYKPEQPALLT